MKVAYGAEHFCFIYHIITITLRAGSVPWIVTFACTIDMKYDCSRSVKYKRAEICSVHMNSKVAVAAAGRGFVRMQAQYEQYKKNKALSNVPAARRRGFTEVC